MTAPPFEPKEQGGAALFRARTRKLGADPPPAPALSEDPRLPAAPRIEADIAEMAPADAEAGRDEPSLPSHDTGNSSVPATRARSHALTTDEQDAFRAIAAALGTGTEAGAATPNSDVSAVSRPNEPPAPGAASISDRTMLENRAILDILPIEVVVFHDLAPIFINRFLVDLLDAADLRSLIRALP